MSILFCMENDVKCTKNGLEKIVADVRRAWSKNLLVGPNWEASNFTPILFQYCIVRHPIYNVHWVYYKKWKKSAALNKRFVVKCNKKYSWICSICIYYKVKLFCLSRIITRSRPTLNCFKYILHDHDRHEIIPVTYSI